jgi:hypothetical protein
MRGKPMHERLRVWRLATGQARVEDSDDAELAHSVIDHVLAGGRQESLFQRVKPFPRTLRLLGVTIYAFLSGFVVYGVATAALCSMSVFLQWWLAEWPWGYRLDRTRRANGWDVPV